MKTIGIYTITNKVDGKMYVGTTKDVKKRLNCHYSFLVLNKHPNEFLQNAVNKYGIQNFEFDVLEEISEDFLYSQEHYWCNLLKAHDRNFGYNLLPTHPQNVRIISEETKQKLSLIRKGKKISSETLNKRRLYSKITKLDVEKVRRIKILLRNPYKKLTNIADEFNTTPAIIIAIKKGITWKDVKI